MDVSTYLDNAEKAELEHMLAQIERRLGQKSPLRFDAGMEIFTMAEGRKCLTVEQLITVTNTFYAWNAEAGTALQKLARVRIWLVFLLIRFGGLRLGEALCLNEQDDVDPCACRIAVRGKYARQVSLPPTVMREITGFLDSPMYYSLKNKVFKLDQGYVRRKFYELADICGLPRNLLNPTVLRVSRAVELLRGGVPSRVVQSFLGEQNLNVITDYFTMPDETVRRIVDAFLQKEGKMATSARNSFSGKVTGIKQDGLLVEVELATATGLKVVSVITEESYTTLGLAEGVVATATVKAPWVILEDGDAVKTSARNRYSGKVTEVKTSKIAAEVIVTLDEGSRVCALVTMESVENLGIEPGKPMNVLFKAFAVIINVEQ